MAEVKDVKKLSEAGIRITVCSGIPYMARHTFLAYISPVLEYLDSDLTAILRPNVKTSAVFLKTAAVALLSCYEQIYPVEDDYYVAQCLAAAGNTLVFMPIDEKTAQFQPHLQRLKFPTNLSRTNGQIEFNSGSGQILDRLSELILS